MKTKNLIILFIGIILLVGVVSAIPQTFNVHGKLTDVEMTPRINLIKKVVKNGE
jgi:hypothetical protein